MLEVDHPHGQAGQDNHLAAFSNCHISLMDYSGGWSEDVPQRTRSLMGTSWPSSLSYTGDGYFIICAWASNRQMEWMDSRMEDSPMGNKDSSFHAETVEEGRTDTKSIEKQQSPC
ncbi:Hypothetical protein (Fragment) [Durusdinium trenchii]|uniref:Uncharacterized protein n=1 Tax=Durusdinium trenchii TaxID=1381693 RepID=A0ABP0H909_9DINO